MRDAADRERMLWEDAQEFWRDDRHWSLGIIYHCSEDPRVIVRNRFWVGWTWNFAHPRVFLAMAGCAVFALAPAAALFTLGVLDVPLLIGVTVAAIAVLAVIAHRIESEPTR